jgi:hypothetical protein
MKRKDWPSAQFLCPSCETWRGACILAPASGNLPQGSRDHCIADRRADARLQEPWRSAQGRSCAHYNNRALAPACSSHRLLAVVLSLPQLATYSGKPYGRLLPHQGVSHHKHNPATDLPAHSSRTPHLRSTLLPPPQHVQTRWCRRPLACGRHQVPRGAARQCQAGPLRPDAGARLREVHVLGLRDY